MWYYMCGIIYYHTERSNNSVFTKKPLYVLTFVTLHKSEAFCRIQKVLLKVQI
jgi:hypothetical protein